MFVTGSHLRLGLLFVGKTGAYPSGAQTGLHLKGRVLSLSYNIRLDQKRLSVTNTPTYYGRKLIMSVTSFRIQSPTTEGSTKKANKAVFKLKKFKIMFCLFSGHLYKILNF